MKIAAIIVFGFLFTLSAVVTGGCAAASFGLPFAWGTLAGGAFATSTILNILD